MDFHLSPQVRFQVSVNLPHALGDLDFRGALGVAKDAPVGFRDIRLAAAIKVIW